MLRSIREPLNEIPSLVNGHANDIAVPLVELEVHPDALLGSLSHNSDQLLQNGARPL